MIDKAITMGLIKGANIQDWYYIFNLICSWYIIFSLLRCFELTNGLKINYNKISNIRIGVEDELTIVAA